MFVRRNKRGVRLYCYGKLPIYKDFLTLKSGRGAPETFKVWMDTGFGTDWGNSGDGPTSVVCPHRILFTPARRDKDVAVAAIWNSHDADGLRRFPFAFFAALPKKAVRRLGDKIITGLTPMWEEMESCYLALEDISDVTGFYGRFRNSRVQPPPRRKARASQGTVSPWQSVTVPEVAAAVYGDKCQDSWTGLLSRLGDAISYARRTAGKTAGIALRLPLAASVDGPLQIEMWLCFLRHNLGRKMDAPTVCLPQRDRGENTAFSVLWRDPRPEDVCLLGDGASQYEHVEDLTDSSAAATTGDSCASEVVELTAELFRENCSVGDFAKRTLPRSSR